MLSIVMLSVILLSVVAPFHRVWFPRVSTATPTNTFMRKFTHFWAKLFNYCLSYFSTVVKRSSLLQNFLSNFTAISLRGSGVSVNLTHKLCIDVQVICKLGRLSLVNKSWNGRAYPYFDHFRNRFFCSRSSPGWPPTLNWDLWRVNLRF